MNDFSPLHDLPQRYDTEPMNWEDDGQGVAVGISEVVAFVSDGKVIKTEIRGDIDPNRVAVTFGGIDNRKAVSMVTAEELAAELLKRVNPSWNPDDPHSLDTPRRFVASLKELCDPDAHKFKFTTFPATSDEMVTMGPIPFYTLCAHHVVPFHGNAWISYVPDTLLCGLSKLARAVKQVSKGLWVQEELTATLHGFINDHLYPKGLAVVMRAEHMCMSMRGVQTAGAITTTSKLSGVYMDHDKTAKAEFMTWMEMNK